MRGSGIVRWRCEDLVQNSVDFAHWRGYRIDGFGLVTPFVRGRNAMIRFHVAAAARGFAGFALLACALSTAANASVVTGNYTAGFDINRGYSEASISAPNVSVGALSTGSSQPVDNFFETVSNGAGTTHSFTV